MKSTMPLLRGRRILGIAAAAALGLAALTAGPAAQAAPAPAAAASAVPLTVSAAALPLSVSAPQTAGPVTAHGRSLNAVHPATSCTIVADNPFEYSGEPYGEGVEGLVSVSCTGEVYELEIDAGIENVNDPDYSATSGYDAEYYTIEYANNVEYPLESGYWETCGIAYVWWSSSSDSEIGDCSSEVWIA